MSKRSNSEITSPPSGAGNVPGLGEAFSINMNTGQGSYSFNISLPEGRNGFTPQLKLEYVHGAGNGIFGLGWRMPIANLKRRIDLASDGGEEHLLMSGVEIAPLDREGNYGPLVEKSFNRYRRDGDGWKVEERNGVVHMLGNEPSHRISHPRHPERVHEWLLESSRDSSGNEIKYLYDSEEGIPYPKEIRYAIYRLTFEYEERPDVRTNGRAGFLRKLSKRCRKMVLHLRDETVIKPIRSWNFSYKNGELCNVSLLNSIQLISHDIDGVEERDVARKPVVFGYTPFETDSYRISFMETPEGAEPPSLRDSDVALVTMDNAPLPGILQVRQGKQYYWRNRGNGKWDHPVPLKKAPFIQSFGERGVAFIDMNRSGNADLTTPVDGHLHGYYENRGRDGWGEFIPYPRGNMRSPLWDDSRTRLGDLNGNGRIDAVTSTHNAYYMYENEGSRGWKEPFLIPRTTENGRIEADFDDRNVHMADMTGDGLSDIVKVLSGEVIYWPNLGNGTFGDAIVMERSPRLRGLHGNGAQVILTDVKGDGCADLVYVKVDRIEIHFNNNGSSFSEKVEVTDIPPVMSGTVRSVDMKGRGRKSLLYNSESHLKTHYVTFTFNENNPSFLLSAVDNGAGLRSQIRYRSAVEDYIRDRDEGSLWNMHFPFPLTVVDSIHEKDVVSGDVIEVFYRYHEAHYDKVSRSFKGFSMAEKIENGDESRPSTLTKLHFLNGEELKPGNSHEHAALNGHLFKSEIFGLDGSGDEDKPYRIEKSGYAISPIGETANGRDRVFLHVTESVTIDRERTDDFRAEEKIYAYDSFGNVVSERVRGYGKKNGEDQPERIKISTLEYAAPSGNHYVVDKTSRISVRDGNGNLLTETRFYYDGASFEGVDLGSVERGLLSREEQLVDKRDVFLSHYTEDEIETLGYHEGTDLDGDAAVFKNSRRFGYDQRGLKTVDMDPAGNRKVIEYDDDGVFRVKLTDPIGETTFTYHRGVGSPTRIVYADGAEVSMSYDAQGRLLSSVMPGDDPKNPSRSMRYDDSSIPYARISLFRVNDSEKSEVLTYFDGWGKEFQTRSEAGDNLYVVSGHKRKNSFGDVKEEFEPTFSDSPDFSIPETDGAASRKVFYDPIGRIVKSIDYNGGVSTSEYHPFEVILHDSCDNDSQEADPDRIMTPKIESFDVLRFRVKTAQIMEDGTAVETGYSMGLDGTVMDVSDSHGIIAAYTYDKTGNRIQLNHREAGVRKTWYNARGDAVRTGDANGEIVDAEVDSSGRLKKLSVGGEVVEAYVYDDLSRNALGRIAEVTYRGGSQHFRYDKAGKMLSREYRFDGVEIPRILGYEYDGLGREKAVIHPDGRRIEKLLTANGWVRTVPGFIDNVSYNSRGLPETIRYSNGVETTVEYNAGPGKVISQKTVNRNGQVFEDLSYTYDMMGRMKSSRDTVRPDNGTVSYEYDPLSQILSRKTELANSGETTVFDYVNNFNLAASDDGTFRFIYESETSPDMVTALVDSAGKRIETGYDSNGNLIECAGQRYRFNFKGEMEHFENDGGVRAEYRYDHKGHRISKIVEKDGIRTETYFIGRNAELRDGQVTGFVFLGNQRVAVARDDSIRFVHNNYMGSTAFFSDENGTKIASIAYTMFGNIAEQSGNADHRTFGTHPFDTESGLCYMYRRYYSPQMGRFLTPDPVAVFQPKKCLSNPKAFRPYMFLGNEPLNNIDPDGLSFWSVVGAIAGVAAVVVTAGAVIAIGGVAGLIVGVVLAIGFVCAAYAFASASDYGSNTQEFFRGFMIGFNAGLNVAIGTAVFGPFVGIALGVINFLAAFDTIAQSEFYQGVLGWSAWFMPMSWAATGLGLGFFAVNLVAALFTLNQVDAVKIHSISIDWGTGTIVTEGGALFLPEYSGGYNLGNFTFVTEGSDVVAHETGHTLSNAAFGSIFHFVGAVDENWIQENKQDAFAEWLAEGQQKRGYRKYHPMWT